MTRFGVFRFFVALVLCAFGCVSAHAELVTGYLAECAAVGTGTCTEPTASGYSRQPIVFGDAVRGVSVNAVPYTFGSGAPGVIAGRAVYDAMTGGNLLFVIPLATAIASPPVDQGDVATLRVTISALAGLQSARIYSGTVLAATSFGVAPDGSAVSSGVKLVIRSGVLTSALPSFDASANGPVTLATGFAVTSLINQATYAITGAGTLASGAVTMPSAPLDGQSFRLLCGVTVTALTVLPASGQTLVGSVTSCGASAGHEWVYFGGTAKTWFQLV